MRVHLSLAIVVLLLVVRLGALGLPAGLLLFASVLAHELGHALVARRKGLRILGINLHVLGGTALMGDLPRRPTDELQIAIAGPLVSFFLGAVFLAASLATGTTLASEGPALLLPWAAGANLAMGAFNLLPALPMDGGRILRAALSLRLGDLRATRISAKVARAFAFLFLAGGLYLGAWTLPLIGAFVYVLAGVEERRAERLAELDRPLLYVDRDGLVIDVTPADRRRHRYDGARWV